MYYVVGKHDNRKQEWTNFIARVSKELGGTDTAVQVIHEWAPESSGPPIRPGSAFVADSTGRICAYLDGSGVMTLGEYQRLVRFFRGAA